MSATSLLITALLQGATLTPTSATVAKGDDEVRCRRIEVTGSIARKEKVCKSIGEWRRLSESGNSVARAVVEYSTSRQSGQ